MLDTVTDECGTPLEVRYQVEAGPDGLCLAGTVLTPAHGTPLDVHYLVEALRERGMVVDVVPTPWWISDQPWARPLLERFLADEVLDEVRHRLLGQRRPLRRRDR